MQHTAEYAIKPHRGTLIYAVLRGRRILGTDERGCDVLTSSIVTEITNPTGTMEVETRNSRYTVSFSPTE